MRLDGECDWTAGIPACNIVASAMSAVHLVESASFDAAEATALQAGMPAVQSHPPPFHPLHPCKKKSSYGI
ncbi:MAG: hypothetical protein DMF63_06340 [Acidobacteria bacterium]|nr:MAG: hypothetical protein DMF63_06340 [Acidobacteriota bacterium]